MSTAQNNLTLLPNREILSEQSMADQTTTFSDINRHIQNPVSPAAPCVKPLEDLYGDIPHLTLSPGLEVMMLEESGIDGWTLDGNRVSTSNATKEHKSTEQEAIRPSRVAHRGSYNLKAHFSTPAKFSIKKHLQSLHLSKVN